MRDGSRVHRAVRAMFSSGSVSGLQFHKDKVLSDFKGGAPSRADGFMTPITKDEVLDAASTRCHPLRKVRHALIGSCACAILPGHSAAVNAACKGRCRLWASLGPTLPGLLRDRHARYLGELPKFVAWARLSAAGDRRTVPGRIVVTAKDDSNATDTKRKS
jgi:hypothetical protein